MADIKYKLVKKFTVYHRIFTDKTYRRSNYDHIPILKFAEDVSFDTEDEAVEYMKKKENMCSTFVVIPTYTHIPDWD